MHPVRTFRRAGPSSWLCCIAARATSLKTEACPEIFRQKKGPREAAQESVLRGERMHPASLPIPAKTPRMMRARCCALLTAAGLGTRGEASICGLRRSESCARTRSPDFFLSREINRTVMRGFHPAFPSRA